MLTIRLQRIGKKNDPTYRIVVVDSRQGPKSGNALDTLGSYDPRNRNKMILNIDRAKEWIAKGAQPSDTVFNILVDKKVVEGKKRNALPKKTPVKKETAEGEVEEKAAVTSSPTTEAPKDEPDEVSSEEVKEEASKTE